MKNTEIIYQLIPNDPYVLHRHPAKTHFELSNQIFSNRSLNRKTKTQHPSVCTIIVLSVSFSESFNALRIAKNHVKNNKTQKFSSIKQIINNNQRFHKRTLIKSSQSNKTNERTQGSIKLIETRKSKRGRRR